jgi:hypothetical protein
VLLDADFNEQAAIYAYLGRRLAADLIGRHAGPALPQQAFPAFEIGESASQGGGPSDFAIGAGRYYVDGIMIDATPPVSLDPVPSDKPGSGQGSSPVDHWTYWTQPEAYLDQENQADLLPPIPYLIYVKVSERFISAVEDPDILETALGPALPDTTGRVKVTWQVLPTREGDGFKITPNDDASQLRQAFDAWADKRNSPAAWLAARTVPPKTLDDPCTVAPDSRYRGPENQLYRVEVHRGGIAGKDAAASATFKWSRENASVIFPVSAIEGTWVGLAALGRDDKLDLNVEDWVEVVDDAYLAHDAADPLLQVAEIDVPGRRVRLSAEPDPAVGRIAQRHPYLRRWDQQAATGRGAPRLWEGAVQIKEGSWTDLEDGVQVWFKPSGTYNTGDYWLIPARTLTGDVEWPRDASGTPLMQPPAGIEYHYAPLAYVRDAGDFVDLRQQFVPLATPYP